MHGCIEGWIDTKMGTRAVYKIVPMQTLIYNFLLSFHLEYQTKEN